MVNKKAAIELSMTTVVVIVLAMSMLILGLVLIRSIFTGATQNVVSINERVKAQIDKLFTEENQETALFLSNGIAQVSQGQSWGISFALKNPGGPGVGTKMVSYTVTADTPNAANCGGITNPMSLVVAGSSSGSQPISLDSGKSYYGLIRIQVPKDARIGCILRYHINPTGTGTTFDFDVEIR